jgi:signal transduction histidine kinase
MNNISTKLICAITAFSLTIAIIVGAFSLARSSILLTQEIEGRILSSSEKYSNAFSSKFNHTEGLVDSLAAMVTVTFDAEQYTKTPDTYLAEYMEYLKPIVQQSITATQLAHGLYVTFNPNFTPGNDEVWYSYRNGEVQYVNAVFDQHMRDFKMPIGEDMLYYFEPIRLGRPCWTGPYFDKDIALNVLSYSEAIYVGDLFVGIAGADITTADTIDIMDEMKTYESGYAFLVDENLNVIIHPEYQKNTALADIEGHPLEEYLDDISSSSSGVVYYTMNGEKMLMGFSHLANGWILAITQPKSIAFSPILDLNRIMTTLAIFIFTIVIVFSIIFSRAFSKPIEENQAALEAQNREKEVMLIYQSRQAKIGEMVGNITHQWKQPLNSINLILINLLDAYRYNELDEAKLEGSVNKVDAIIKRMSDTITDFTNFLKPSLEKECFQIGEYINMALSLMEESIKQHHIKVRYIHKEDTPVYGNPNELAHVIFNIINNSRDAIIESCPEEKLIEIGICTPPSCVWGSSYTELTIFNTGDNIGESILPNVFDPYFTTKGKEGTGLGLYISKIIIEQRMNGKITLSNVDGGVCCTIQLPTSEQNEPQKEDL